MGLFGEGEGRILRWETDSRNFHGAAWQMEGINEDGGYSMCSISWSSMLEREMRNKKVMAANRGKICFLRVPWVVP